VAGARAVQIGTANFVNPLATTEIIEGMRKYLHRYKLNKISDIVGTLQVPG